jgi:hypothetical protein
MIATFIILISLLAVLPALMMVNGILANGLASAIVATALLTMAVALNSDDLDRFFRILRPTAFIILFIPCIWMLFQIVPFPGRYLANPVWVSASTALGKPLVDAISLDIGGTLLSLAHYCTSLAAAFVTAAVSLNKQRAGSVLSLLAAIATLITVEKMAFDLGYLRWLGFASPDAMVVAVMGFILCCGTMIRAYERLSSRNPRHRDSRKVAKVEAVASIAALLICLSAILIDADTVLLLAAMLGVGVLLAVWAIRKWRLGLWGHTGMAALAAVAVVGFFTIAPAKKDADVTLAFSTQARTSSIERMLSDTKWGGSGAGSFEAFLPIYRDTNELDSLEIPTAAATIAIEMGKPFLCACVIIFLTAASTLFRRALLRGRDYVYSSVGAGCIIALLVSIFSNNGSLGFVASVMISVLCGLAFAQSKGTANKKLDLDDASYNTRNNHVAPKVSDEV